MSGTPRIPLAHAMVAAELVRGAVAEACERAVVAGSVRRHVSWHRHLGREVPGADVGDVELVVEPRLAQDLFGAVSDAPTDLDVKLDALIVGGMAELLGRRRQRARQVRLLVTVDGHRVPVELYIVRPPAQWGAILAIRTGPAEYSRRLVTECRRHGLRCEGGRLIDDQGRDVATPEERDFVQACGLPYVEPWERVAR